MKHIVFVCQVFFPDNTATSQLFGELLTNLANSTTKITVLCGYPTRRAGGDRAPAREIWSGIEIVRCGIDIDSKRSYWARFTAYVSFLAAMSVRLLQIPNKDVVFGVTNPPFLAIMLWLLSYVGGFHYQYMFQDLYPEGLIALDKLAHNSLIARLWRTGNKPSFQHAEKLIVLGRDMRTLLSQEYAIDPDKLIYLPPWSSMAIQQPLSFAANDIAGQLGLNDKFVVQYSGNMGLWHDMNAIVQAAAQLQVRPDIHFLLIGGGMRRKEAQELARELQLTNISWLDFFPKERLAESLTCCHVALVSLRPGLEGVAVPSKLYGILASGRAVVAQVPTCSEIAFVVEEEQCGIVVEPGNVDALVHAILTLAEDPRTTTEMGRRAFAAYEEKYTLDQAVEHFRNLWADNPPSQSTPLQVPSPIR